MIGVTVERTVTKDHMQCECPDMDVQKSKGGSLGVARGRDEGVGRDCWRVWGFFRGQ
jgi:hypothetical protein